MITHFVINLNKFDPMKKYILSVAFCLAFIKVFAWGPNGHRIVGEIAFRHLSDEAKKNIKVVLGNESLAMVGTYMDFIRSNDRYRHMGPWHYCTIPDNKTYEEASSPEEGDAYVTIERLLKELESKKFTDEDELLALKMLVHLVGDIHQPLHVGNGEDRGGNDVKLEFFWERSNLHRVWDEGIIDQQKLSFTEYANWIDFPTKKQLQKWQKDTLMEWVMESKEHRKQAYDLPENKKINYQYIYKNIDLVNLRLLQAGVRLAGVLNKIYG